MIIGYSSVFWSSSSKRGCCDSRKRFLLIELTTFLPVCFSNAQFRVLHLMNPFCTHLRQPTFKGFCFFGCNRLDNAEDSLK